MNTARWPVVRIFRGLYRPALLFACVYLLAILVHLPLRLAVGFISLPPEVRLAGCRDSVWSGKVDSLMVADKDRGRLQYTARPWKFLLGQVEYVVDLHNGDDRLRAVLNRSLWSGEVRIADMTGRVTMASLRDLLAEPLVLGGFFSVELKSLAWLAGERFMVDGIVQWNEALFGLGEPANLGSMLLEFDPRAAGTRIEFGSQGGEVLVAGNAQLTEDGRYEAAIELAPGETLTQAGRRLLSLAGVAAGGGNLELSGSLF